METRIARPLLEPLDPLDRRDVLGSTEGAGPPAWARIGWTRITREEQSVHLQPCATTVPQCTSGPAVPPEELYFMGNRRGRIAAASVALSTVLALGAIVLLSSADLAAVLLCGFPALWLVAYACKALGRPYEICIASSGLLRFVSVMDSTEFSAADITSIVRRERVSNRALDTVRVEYPGGSVTLNGDEAICRKLMDLSPKASVKTEEYDDTGD